MTTDNPATEPELRAAFIAGLLDLACFLESHPDVPVPIDYPDTMRLLVFPDGDTDDEQRAGVDDVAAMLGVTAADERGTGHYTARLAFGPVTYEACAISRERRARSRAADSYRDNVITDCPAVAA